MRKIGLLLTILLCLPQSANAAIMVVMKQLDFDVLLSKQQIRQVYLGKNIQLQNNITSSAVSLSRQHKARKQFNARVIGLTESRLQSYWAHMRFSGRSKPPPDMDSIDNLFSYLLTHPGALGYVPEGTPLPPGIVTIYP